MENYDKKFVRKCIELSEQSFKNGGAPFGSLIVRDEKIFADSINNAQNRISDHAEILTLDKAHKKKGTSNLDDCILYSNCEPCPMCSFMIREYRIKKVVFALPSLYMGGYSKWKILQDEELSKFKDFFGKPPEVISGLLESDAKKVMNKFYPLINVFGSDVRGNYRGDN